MKKPLIQAFYDSKTWTISYVVYDKPRGNCAIIDPVLDYEHKSSTISTQSADRLIAFIRREQLVVDWILETHAHADHLSAGSYLKNQVGGKVAIGDQIPMVQQTFKSIFNLDDAFVPDGRQFDYLFAADEIFQVGELTVQALAVSGHTPADIAYRIDDVIFVGDTLFMPDIGTARADFPGGNAQQLYRSIRKILSYPPQTRLYMCHDYPPVHRSAAWESNVAAQRVHNIHIRDGISEDAFVSMRNQRDKTLEMPTLLLPSIQTNIWAGQLPSPESNGVSYFKIPINRI